MNCICIANPSSSSGACPQGQIFCGASCAIGNCCSDSECQTGQVCKDNLCSLPGCYTITEFPSNISPFDITTGADGNLWFASRLHGKIGRITPTGTVTEFNVPTSNSQPSFITAGPDGNLWFTELSANKIGRITTNGTVTEFNIPTANSWVSYITSGPDGNLWFVERDGNKIGRITTGGAITEFNIPTTSNIYPTGITSGPDGNLWFTNSGAGAQNYIGKITTDGIVVSTYTVTTDTAADITLGPDGNLWFTEDSAYKIGKITTFLIGEPSITSITPTTGPASGGTPVTISGTNLNNVTKITFGNTTQANISSSSNNQLIVSSPVGTAGTASTIFHWVGN